MKRVLIAAAVVLFNLFVWVVVSQAATETRIEESLKLAPGGKLVLDADEGGVDVKGGSTAGVHVVVTSTRSDIKDRFDFKFEEGPNSARITAKRKGHPGLFSSWTGDNLHFEVDVPTETGLEIHTSGGHIQIAAIHGDAILRTGGGHIDVSRLTGKLDARTSGGHIQLTQIEGDSAIQTSGGHIEADSLKGSLDASTSGGHISVHTISGDLRARTSGGHIEIEKAGGHVQAETSGGHITASLASGNGAGGSLESGGGGIHVRIDPNTDLEVDAEASGGSVDTKVPIAVVGTTSRSSLHGTLGKGGPTLRLRTSGGSIGIEPL